MTGPRSTEQRRADALYRLGHDVDAWVATELVDVYATTSAGTVAAVRRVGLQTDVVLDASNR